VLSLPANFFRRRLKNIPPRGLRGKNPCDILYSSQEFEVIPVAEKTPPITLTDKEKQLIKLIRDLGFGEIRIMVADSQPVRAEEIKKSIKF